MDIHLTFRHLEATDGLKAYIEQKAEKLLKYLVKPLKMNVVFSMERFVHKVDITLFEKNHIFKAQGATNDMYASMDEAIHNIEQQLRRYKEKIKNHKNYFKTPEALLEEAHSLHDEKSLSVERLTNRVATKKKVA